MIGKNNKLGNHEVWLDTIGWPYKVSYRGHVRRRRGETETRLTSDGYTIVVLRRGQYTQEVYLDSLVLATFNGLAVDNRRPIHLNGLAWDNWYSNLRWCDMAIVGDGANLVTHWMVIREGRLQHGPYTDQRAATAAAQMIGDNIIGRNKNGQIIAYEVVFSRDRTLSPRNPFHMVKRYRALAAQHNNQMWSIELSEAALLIETLALEAIGRIAGAKREQLEQDYYRVAEAQPTMSKRTRRVLSMPAPPVVVDPTPAEVDEDELPVNVTELYPSLPSIAHPNAGNVRRPRRSLAA